MMGVHLDSPAFNELRFVVPAAVLDRELPRWRKSTRLEDLTFTFWGDQWAICQWQEWRDFPDWEPTVRVTAQRLMPITRPIKEEVA